MIQQDDVNALALQNLQGGSYCGTVRDLKIRVCAQGPGNTLTKYSVIVHKKRANRFHLRSSIPFSGPQLYCEAASAGLLLTVEVASLGTQHGAGNVKTEAGRFGG